MELVQLCISLGWISAPVGFLGLVSCFVLGYLSSFIYGYGK